MRRDWPISIVLLLLLAALFVTSLLAGRVWLPVGEVWDGLWSKDGNLAATIVTQLRLPRAVLALEVGGALGVAGAVLQGVTRNPLAEPGLLGVSAGAALGAVIAVYFGYRGTFHDRRATARPDRRTACELFDLCTGPRRRNDNLGARRSRCLGSRGGRNCSGAQFRAQPLCCVRNHDLADGLAGGPQLEARNSGDAVHPIGLRYAAGHGAWS